MKRNYMIALCLVLASPVVLAEPSMQQATQPTQSNQMSESDPAPTQKQTAQAVDTESFDRHRVETGSTTNTPQTVSSQPQQNAEVQLPMSWIAILSVIAVLLVIVLLLLMKLLKGNKKVLDNIESRLDNIESRLDNMAQHVREMKSKIEEINEDVLTEILKEIKELRLENNKLWEKLAGSEQGGSQILGRPNTEKKNKVNSPDDLKNNDFNFSNSSSAFVNESSSQSNTRQNKTDENSQLQEIEAMKNKNAQKEQARLDEIKLLAELEQQIQPFLDDKDKSFDEFSILAKQYTKQITIFCADSNLNEVKNNLFEVIVVQFNQTLLTRNGVNSIVYIRSLISATTKINKLFTLVDGTSAGLGTIQKMLKPAYCKFDIDKFIAVEKGQVEV